MIDFLLLNACSVNSSGLHNGKAGFSLCLFELSRFLQDDYLENQAVELLQEALLTKSEDIGFENGLSGIGYVLLYLIKYKFIDADIEDLFGSQQKKIEGYIERLKLTGTEPNKESFVRHNLKVMYFLDLLSQDNKFQNTTSSIAFFSETAQRIQKEYVSAIETRKNVSLKTEYIAFFETYLKVSASCRSFQFSVDSSDLYTQLFTQKKLVSTFTIGHCLGRIATEKNNIRQKVIAETNRVFALKNLYPATMSLAQRVGLLCLLRLDEELYNEQIILLEKDFFESPSQPFLEKNLLSSIGLDCFVAGYQSGIARFLLYWVFRNTDKEMRERIQFL